MIHQQITRWIQSPLRRRQKCDLPALSGCRKAEYPSFASSCSSGQQGNGLTPSLKSNNRALFSGVTLSAWLPLSFYTLLIDNFLSSTAAPTSKKVTKLRTMRSFSFFPQDEIKLRVCLTLSKSCVLSQSNPQWFLRLSLRSFTFTQTGFSLWRLKQE